MAADCQGQDHACEDARAIGDFTRRQVVEALQIIGPEHEHDDVDGLVTFQAGREELFGIAANIERILMHGGAPVLTFFDDSKSGTEFFGEQSGPAHVDGMTDWEGGRDAGGVKAPGV